MKKGNNIRLRSDGRYEARYAKGRDCNGKLKYGYCYGNTYEEAKEKRDYQLQKLSKPKGLNLLILGAGSHGHDVYEIAKSYHIFSKIDFLDDDPNKEERIGGWNKIDDLIDEYPVAIVAVGDEETRRCWMQRLYLRGYITPSFVHPTAYIPENTEIGIGTVICARATIGSNVTIGTGCIITSGSTVPRNTFIPDWGYFDFDMTIRYREKYNLNNA